jgi:hypothetical protein
VVDITKENCEMSLVFLQGGGLSKRQLDEAPSARKSLIGFVRRWLVAISPDRRRNISRD